MALRRGAAQSGAKERRCSEWRWGEALLRVALGWRTDVCHAASGRDTHKTRRARAGATELAVRSVSSSHGRGPGSRESPVDLE